MKKSEAEKAAEGFSFRNRTFPDDAAFREFLMSDSLLGLERATFLAGVRWTIEQAEKMSFERPFGDGTEMLVLLCRLKELLQLNCDCSQEAKELYQLQEDYDSLLAQQKDRDFSIFKAGFEAAREIVEKREHDDYYEENKYTTAEEAWQDKEK